MNNVKIFTTVFLIFYHLTLQTRSDLQQCLDHHNKLNNIALFQWYHSEKSEKGFDYDKPIFENTLDTHLRIARRK